MDTLTLFLLVAVVALAVILFLASRKPDTFTVERRAVIRAPAEPIFNAINTLAVWNDWSPWAKKDPDVKNVLSGPASGKGAKFAWEGNSKVGKGRMEIIESAPTSRVILRLDFEKPIANSSTATFSLTPKDGGTEVHWAMTGPNLFIGKVMSLFMNMDKMVGRDFENGLENLRAKVGG